MYVFIIFEYNALSLLVLYFSTWVNILRVRLIDLEWVWFCIIMYYIGIISGPRRAKSIKVVAS
jgi:hypothetical protein